MIKIFGKDVTILHLHDNTGHWDDHLLPGFGNINWPGVFDALDEIGYSGVYNFEIRLPFGGSLLEDFLVYSGKYLREFVDRRGNLK
jgi:sugar phosphate isomerase/epimerase